MDNKKFIKENHLQLFFNIEESEMLRAILKRLNESYVIEWNEEESDGLSWKGNEKGFMFRIYSPVTTFASAYFEIGKCVAKEIVSKRKK